MDLTAEEKRIWRNDFENMISALRGEIDLSDHLTKEEKEGWQRFLTQCLASSNGAADKLQSMSETESATAVALVKHVIRSPENLRAVLRAEMPALLAEYHEKERVAREQLDAEAAKKKHPLVLYVGDLVKLTPKQTFAIGCVCVYLILKATAAPDGAINAVLAKLISLLT